MAIKSISKLDPFNNEVTDQTVKDLGGSLRMFTDKYHSVEANRRDQKCAKPEDHTTFHTLEETTNEGNEDSYYNSLFEISQPVEKGETGLKSETFNSYKIAYKEIAKNIIIDTKNYLNVRNNLGEFNLCAIVFDDYIYRGHKYFLPGNEIPDPSSNSGVDIKGQLSVDGNAQITGNTNISGNVRIGDSTHNSTLWVKSDISTDANLYVKNGLYTGTLSSDTTGTTINPGSGGFKVIGILTATMSPKKLTIEAPTQFTNNITGTNAYFSGNLTCHNITCDGTADLTAMHALWSDLAEYYLADDKYESGTLMQFGGKNEVTIAKDEVNAIVTSKPAYLMNIKLREHQFGCPLALAGRVPVKIIGKVKKFDKIVLSEIPGIGKIQTSLNQRVIGRALEPNDNEELKLVECIVKFDL